MKRYWKLLFSSLFSLIILGTFYVYMNFPDRGLPHFEIETVEGNKKEVEKLILNGDWIQDNDDQYYPFILTVAETTYLHEQSFFTQLTNLSWSPQINYYISEYRNFMRGKDLDPSVYFENEEYLAYGTVGHEYYQGINNFFFEIALLDKNTNENISFTVDVPNTENYRWLNSYHVELINDQLKIFTINQLNDSEREELHVYVFDWNNESLVSSEKLLSAPVIDNGWSHLTIFNNIDHIGSEKYLLVKSEAYQENLLNDGGINKPVSVEFFVLNTDTNDLEQLDVTPEQILSLEYGNIYDSIIYTSDWTEKGFELRPFHIEKREWQEPISFSIEQKRFMNEMNPQEVYMPFTKIADGKLYIIYPEENGSVLKIMDLESRQEYFTGLIKPKKNETMDENFQVTFNELFIQQ